MTDSVVGGGVVRWGLVWLRLRGHVAAPRARCGLCRPVRGVVRVAVVCVAAQLMLAPGMNISPDGRCTVAASMAHTPQGP